MATVRQFVCSHLCQSVLLCLSQLLSVSLCLFVNNFFVPSSVPLMAFSSCVSPLFLSFFLPLLFSCQLSSPPPLVPDSAPLLSSPPYLHLLTFHLLLFSPGSSCHPNCPFRLLFSTYSFLVPLSFFPCLVFFCVTWHFLPKTLWHLFDYPLILPPFTSLLGPTKESAFWKDFRDLFQSLSRVG